MWRATRTKWECDSIASWGSFTVFIPATSLPMTTTPSVVSQKFVGNVVPSVSEESGVGMPPRQMLHEVYPEPFGFAQDRPAEGPQHDNSPEIHA